MNVMGRIVLQGLGYSERGLTYTQGLKLQEGKESYEQEKSVYRETLLFWTANLDEAERHINKRQVRAANVQD
jgi:hypothetical protein